MLKLFALMLTLVAGAAQADATLHTDLPLSYLEQTQGDARNQPLVIFLHGFGSNEQDLFGIKDALPSTWTYLSARAPMAVDSQGYRWFTKTPGDGDYDGVSADLQSSARLIEDFVTQATAKVDAFEKATDALVDSAKAHKDEQPMMWSSMESALESYRVAAKERLRRVRDKTPYSQGDRMMLNANSGWMISGSPDKLVRNYNELITTSNRLN